MDLISYILSKKYTDKGLAVKADLISGKVPASELPSYVDDVEEYADLAHFPVTGEAGKIYVAIDTGFTYRWTGSQYVQIGGGTTYSSFNASWPTTGTTKAFCDAVNADATVAIGKAYLGGATFTDLPFNGNGDIVVEILQGPSSTKSIHLILTSGDVYPYRWEYTYWNNGSDVSGWVGYQPELPSGNNNTYLHKNASTGNLEWSNIDASGIDTTGETSGKVLTANGTGGASWQNPSGMTNPMSAAGDLIVGGSSGTPQRLAMGTAGQVLKVNAAGTGLEYGADESGMANPMTTAGDIIVGGSSGSPTRLGLGTAGQVLKVNAAGTGLEYGAGGGGNSWLPYCLPFLTLEFVSRDAGDEECTYTVLENQLGTFSHGKLTPSPWGASLTKTFTTVDKVFLRAENVDAIDKNFKIVCNFDALILESNNDYSTYSTIVSANTVYTERTTDSYIIIIPIGSSGNNEAHILVDAGLQAN